ncbi:AfsR/SARP family transcriptional regulator [Streptomyces rhizosphaericus]|uniref:Tetratricopeptide repeat protein n=1 Tax=Streptomyces rhizosphaericus TaxID=114699 RepID=A0A6G4A915_9ACTN|nr:tetratricopeptide repeat protein [Streptomyces rhizosphaericus]NEW69191.1 tetratricopeptide repeat protein [Streptomyces rhizosphaericus]
MRVQVLGPLRAWHGEAGIDLGTPHQRALLGLLVLAGGRSLSRAELADALWRDRPPRSAVNLIQTYVKRLRRLLEPTRPARTPSALLPRVGDGYALRVPQDDVDLSRFRQLATRAEAARRDGDDRGAAALLAEALRLWQSPPMADLPLLAAHPAVVALAEERRAAVAKYGDAMIAAGDAEEALPLLAETAAAHPLDERAQARLMRAHGAVGQRDTAFTIYLDSRRRLADELGVEPGAELIAAYTALLGEAAGRPGACAAGPTGTRSRGADVISDAPGHEAQPVPGPVPGHEPGPTSGSVPGPASGSLHRPRPGDDQPTSPDRPAPPAQLPADVYGFTGRSAELSALDRPWAGDERPGLRAPGPATIAPGPATMTISVISGTAGVGKTALAVHWAHQARDRFPDGQLYVNLRGYDPDRPLSSGDALTRFLRALGLSGRHIPLDPDERASRYRTEMADRRMLVVLDNALSVEQVRPLLPGTPSCAVLVTSRDSLAGLVALHGAQRIELGPLVPAEATALLRLLIGDRARTDHTSSAVLAEQCARLPLALRVAAELAATRPGVTLSELVAELSDQQRRLELLDAGGDSRATVRSVFFWSYRHLPPAAARTFRLLALHPGPDFGVHATAALTGEDVDRAGSRLALLTRAHLVRSSGPGRYAMHDLLRAYADRLSLRYDERADRQAAGVRLLDHYLAGATAAMDTLYPAERHHRPGTAPTAASAPPMRDQAAARAWLSAEIPVMSSVCARAADGHRADYAVRLAAVLFRHLDGGHHMEALSFHTHALRAAEHIGDRAGRAHALTNLGVVHWRLGAYRSAAVHLRQALVLHRASGDRAGQARTLSNLGNVHWRSGDHPSAAHCHQQALSLYEELADRVGQARTLTNLGNVCQRQGKYDLADAYQRRALELHGVTGDQIGRARTLTNLGTVCLRQGRYEAAADHHGQALELFRRFGHHGGQGYAMTGLGDVYLRQGLPLVAADHHRQALRLFRTNGERYGEASALNGLGEALRGAGRPGEAVVYHVRAEAVAASTGERDEQARARLGAALARGDSDAADASPTLR